jgi:hypothetical protein
MIAFSYQRSVMSLHSPRCSPGKTRPRIPYWQHAAMLTAALGEGTLRSAIAERSRSIGSLTLTR